MAILSLLHTGVYGGSACFCPLLLCGSEQDQEQLGRWTFTLTPIKEAYSYTVGTAEKDDRQHLQLCLKQECGLKETASFRWI